VSVGHRHEGDPIDDALARLAEPLVAEIAGGRPERLRICANDACRWVFFDASPTGRRRWCSMASCGNRAKAARHRARHRGGQVEAASA
jgi:predicted RNA-binding Zn ribbon-like protein